MIEFIFDTPKQTLHCALAGRIDSLNCTYLEKALKDKFATFAVRPHDAPADASTAQVVANLPEGFAIVFDLARVEYIASAFLRICQVVAKNLRSGVFSMINSTPPIKKIFKISGLDQLLNVR